MVALLKRIKPEQTKVVNEIAARAIAKGRAHSTKVKNKPKGLPEEYVDLLIESGSHRSKALKAQLKHLVMKGGSVSSAATEEVDRGVLYRALKRFEKTHELLINGASILDKHGYQAANCE